MKRIRVAFLVLFACFGSAALCQQSAVNPLNNWSEFHRSDMQRYNPYEDTLGVSNVADLKLKWGYPMGTDEPSSPVVAGGVVYVQTLAGLCEACGIVFAVKDGSLLWSYNEGLGGGSDSTAAVADGVLYFGNYSGFVQAMDASTGAFLWISEPIGDYIDSSPAVSLGMVFVGSAFDGNTIGTVTALSTIDGTVVWSFSTGAEVASSPAVVGNVVYVGSEDNNVYALKARTGAKLWSYTTGGYVNSSPAVANGVVYVGSWDNNFYALNATTGAKLWSYTTGGAVQSSPAVANGVVYVGSDDNYLYALNATTGALLWSYNTGGTVSSPAVANGVVYVGAVAPRVGYGNNLYALNASTGALLWSYVPDIPAANTSAYSPSVADGQVYFGSNYGNSVVAFGLK